MTLTTFFISVLSNAQDSLHDQTRADCPCGILGTTDKLCSATGQRKWGAERYSSSGLLGPSVGR
jgi:hypothetical protein